MTPDAWRGMPRHAVSTAERRYDQATENGKKFSVDKRLVIC
jgi:hypothetical protein